MIKGDIKHGWRMKVLGTMACIIALPLMWRNNTQASEVTFEERVVVSDPPITYSMDELVVFIKALNGYWKLDRRRGTLVPVFCVTPKTDELCSYMPKEVSVPFIKWILSSREAGS